MEKDSRQIRIFISSTFQDMQEERDYLMNKTFPVLRQLAAKRNVSIVEVDLRWGITKELSENNKTLQVCLEEIDNSRPFFIGILGDRYGWCPDGDEYNNNRTLQDHYHWVLDCIKHGKSITEMEIQYGALNHELHETEDVQAFFYIKENSDETDCRLHELKEAVRHNLDHHPCSTYSSPADLGDQVSKAFAEILNKLYPEKELSVLERLRMEQEAFISSRCSLYIPYENDERFLDGFLSNRKVNSLLVVAPSGMGKSALLANWIVKHREEIHYEWFYHFIGNTSDNCMPEDIALHLAMEIQERKLTIPANMPKNAKESGSEFLQRTINHLKPQNNVVLVLDGFDHLKNFGDDASVYDWLPVLPTGSKIIVSSVEDSIASFQRKAYRVRKLSTLALTKRKQIVSKYLHRYGKELIPAQEERIARYSQNPMVLHAILNEVRLFGNHERLDAYIKELVSYPSVESLFNAILGKAEHEYGSELVKKSLSWIRMSLSGLFESDIQKMLGCTQLDWSQFYCAFADSFIVRDGFLNFSNGVFIEAVKRRYSDIETQLKKEFVHALKTTKHISHDNAQKELAYQYYHLQDWDNLYKTIIQPRVFAYYQKNEVRLWVEFWRRLIAQGKDGSFAVYLDSDLKGFSHQEKVGYYNALAAFCMGWYPDEAFGTAQKAYVKIIEMYARRKRMSLNEKTDMLNAYVQGAIILSEYLMRYEESSIILEEVLAQLDLLRPSNSSTIKHIKASALFSMGNNKSLQKKYEEAANLYEQAKMLYVEITGEDSKDSIECMGNLGNIYCELYLKNKQNPQYHELSEKNYQEAISIVYKELSSGLNKQIAELLKILIVLLNNIGSLYIESGQYGNAKDKCSSALSLLRFYETINTNRILDLLLDCLFNMGMIYKKQKLYDQALTYFEELLSEAKGKIEVNQGKLVKVFDVLKKMIQIYKDIKDEGNVERCKKEALVLLDRFFPEKEYDELKKAWILY